VITLDDQEPQRSKEPAKANLGKKHHQVRHQRKLMQLSRGCIEDRGGVGVILKNFCFLNHKNHWENCKMDLGTGQRDEGNRRRFTINGSPSALLGVGGKIVGEIDYSFSGNQGKRGGKKNWVVARMKGGRILERSPKIRREVGLQKHERGLKNT